MASETVKHTSGLVPPIPTMLFMGVTQLLGVRTSLWGLGDVCSLSCVSGVGLPDWSSRRLTLLTPERTKVILTPGITLPAAEMVREASHLAV